MAETSTDIVEQLGGSTIQHGKYNDRIYLMKLDPDDLPAIVGQLEELGGARGYTKIFAKVPASAVVAFEQAGYRREALVPGFFGGAEDAHFMALYLDEKRRTDPRAERVQEVIAAAEAKRIDDPAPPAPVPGYAFTPATSADIPELAEVFGVVFPSYPFPIHDPGFLAESMAGDTRYFCARREGRLVAVSSAEMDPAARNAEMTDFATLPEARGQGLATHLLALMEREVRSLGIVTAYTIARSPSFGMNITFAKLGYVYGGTLVNNTNIAGAIESMNVWYKPLATSGA
jgi:putative beta-lysine N-acetyltransferase